MNQRPIYISVRPAIARFFIAIFGLLGLLILIPSRELTGVIHLLIGIAVPVAYVVGARKNQSNRPMAWYLIAGTMALAMSAPTVGSMIDHAFGVGVGDVFKSIDSLIILGMVVTGIGILMRARRPDLRWSVVVDSSIVMIAATLIFWALIGGSSAHVSGDKMQVNVIASVVQFALLMWLGLMAVSRESATSFRLMTVSLCVSTISTVIMTVFPVSELATRVSLCLTALCLVLGAAAALDPTMRQISEPSERSQSEEFGRKKLLFFAIALLSSPITLMIGDVRHRENDVVVSGVTIILVCLILHRFAALVRDRDGAQQEVASSETRFQALVRNSSDVIILVDEEGIIRYATPPIRGLLEIGSHQIVGKNFLNWVHELDVEAARRAMESLKSEESRYVRGEFRVITPHGMKYVSVQMTDARNDEAVNGIVLNVTDASWRKNAEAELETRALREEVVATLARRGLQGAQVQDILLEAAAAVRGVLQNSCVGVWEASTSNLLVARVLEGVEVSEEETEEAAVLATVEGRVLLSSASLQFPNLQEANLDADSFALARGFRSAVVVIIGGNSSPFGLLSVYDANADAFGDDVVAFLESVANVLAVAIERVTSEHELQQAQKLEAVGRLAAGIAHEINTPIQFIGDNLHFLRESFDELIATARGEMQGDLDFLAEEVPSAADQALDGVQRVATIVRAMKAFGHPDTTEMRPGDINQALGNTLIVARNELKYVAEVKSVFGNLPLIDCHIGELSQVFLNLLINAAHAISDKNESRGTSTQGQITVRTWKEPTSVVVAIGDTGSGIPDEIRNRIFDPFFTTKEVGRGTGQGLALAKSVIGKHNGVIKFDSDSSGTIFCIKLPINAAVQSAASSVAS